MQLLVPFILSIFPSARWLKRYRGLVQSTPYLLWLCADPCSFSGSRVETTRSPQLDSAVFIQFHLREAQFTPNSGLCCATHLQALFSPFSSIPSFILLAALQFSPSRRGAKFPFLVSHRATKTCSTSSIYPSSFVFGLRTSRDLASPPDPGCKTSDCAALHRPR